MLFISTKTGLIEIRSKYIVFSVICYHIEIFLEYICAQRCDIVLDYPNIQ